MINGEVEQRKRVVGGREDDIGVWGKLCKLAFVNVCYGGNTLFYVLCSGINVDVTCMVFIGRVMTGRNEDLVKKDERLSSRILRI